MKDVIELVRAEEDDGIYYVGAETTASDAIKNVKFVLSDSSTSTVTSNDDNHDDHADDDGEPVKAITTRGRSLNELIGDVQMAWHEKEVGGWISEVFEKYAIIHKDRKLWKVPYTRDGEDIKFAEMPEWKEVEITRGFVEKNLDKLCAVKSIGDEEIEAYGVIWGDENRKDLHKEYFTEKTQELTAIFDQMGAIPWLFNHASDETLKSTVVGKVVKMEMDDVGLWYRARITEHERYKKYVKPLIDDEALFSSSGTLPAAKRVTKKGQITRWPIVEMTGTHTPAEHRMLNIPISQVNKHYKSIGLPELDSPADTEKTGTASEKDDLNARLQLELEQQRLNLELNELV